MKKALTLLFAAALVLAFALPAMADAGKYLGAANLTMKMQLWQWGTSTDNIGDMDDSIHDKQNDIKQRLRWWLDTDFGDYGAVLGFESDWVWGSDSSGGTSPGPIGSGSGSPRGDDRIAVEVKRSYIWFNVPSTPVKVSAGLGVQGGVDPNDLMFGGNDYFGVRLDLPLGESFTLSGAWLKWDEGENNIAGYGVAPNQDWDSNETSIWFIDLKGSIGKMLSVGTYHFLMHVNENGAAVLDADASGYGFLGDRRTLPVTNGNYYWHGFYARMNAGMFWAEGHFNYFWGDPDDSSAPDMSGWAAIGRVGIKPGPFDVSVRGWYFTGNEYADDSHDWDRWASFNSFFAPLEIFQSGYNSWRAGGLSGYEGAPGGHAFLGIDANWYVTKKLSFHLLGGYIWATEENDKPLYTLGSAANRNTDKGLGFEIDGRARYKLYDHLELQLGIAYLFAGDGLDHVRSAAPDAPLVNADDAYELFWRLYYSF